MSDSKLSFTFSHAGDTKFADKAMNAFQTGPVQVGDKFTFDGKALSAAAATAEFKQNALTITFAGGALGVSGAAIAAKELTITGVFAYELKSITPTLPDGKTKIMAEQAADGAVTISLQ